ncbi:MAG: hypothetical protein DRJ14_06995, partial [Acidobacteria bacterium]
MRRRRRSQCECAGEPERDSPQRPQRALRGRSGGGEGEEFNTRAQRSEKIELRFRNGEWPILFFRALALSLALDRREEERGIQHKGTRAQRTQ